MAIFRCWDREECQAGAGSRQAAPSQRRRRDAAAAAGDASGGDETQSTGRHRFGFGFFIR